MESFGLTCNIIERDSEILAGILYPDMEKRNGEENFPSVDDVKELYRKFAILPDQTHSINVAVSTFGKERYPDTDALITSLPGQPIGVITADCVPILIYSPDIRMVAAIHAGWRGTLNGIVNETISVMESHAAEIAKMKVFFGPSISMENYEVSDELADAFIQAGFKNYVYTNYGEKGRPHIDLQRINMDRFIRAGVNQRNIRLSNECTKSSKSRHGRFIYPSFRRDNTNSSRLLSFIMLFP